MRKTASAPWRDALLLMRFLRSVADPRGKNCCVNGATLFSFGKLYTSTQSKS